MKFHKLQIPGSLALAAFLVCSTGGALLVDSVAPQAANAQDVDVGIFYSNLAPHGQWFFQADFGWVWHPARVGPGWRPYTEGQWLWSDEFGWTWVSDEPWGWATYHYGRWYFDPYYGWSWVPGHTWAPAWVSWRVESGYIGWAPLWPVYFDIHPEYRWDNWHHDHDWDDRHRGRDWDRWVFTRDRDFTSDRVGRHQISDHRERDRIYSQSRDVTQYDESHPERIGHSIDRRTIEQATGRPVRPVTIEAADKPHTRVDTRGDRVQMFRPQVRETTDKTPDRLGLAKEPTPEARKRDTIREEKARLDRVPESQKKPSRTVPDESTAGKGGPQPAAEEQAPGAGSGADRHGGRPDNGGPNAHGRQRPGMEDEQPVHGMEQGQPGNRAEQPAQPEPREAKPQHMRPDRAEQAQPERMKHERVQPEEQPERVQPERVRPEHVQPQHQQREAQPEQMQPQHQQREAQPQQMQQERMEQQQMRQERMQQQQMQQERTQQQQMRQEQMQHQRQPQAERPEYREPPQRHQQEVAPQGAVEHRGNPAPPPHGPQGGANPHRGQGGQPPADDSGQPPPPPHGRH